MAKGFAFSIIKSKAWQLALRITNKWAPTGVKRGLDQALAQDAEFLRGKVVEGLQSGSPGGKPLKPHSAATAAIRRAQGFGGTKILIRDGGMLGSIKVVKTGSTYFVGILRGAKGAGGGRVNLGQLHQTGKSWRMSDAQRRWLFGMLRKAGQLHGRGGTGGGGGRITIPARPFIPPVLEKWGKPRMVAKRVAKRLVVIYRGKLSK